MRLPFIPQDRIARVRLLRTILAWTGWLLAGIGVAHYLIQVSAYTAVPYQGQNFSLFLALTTGLFSLFAWIPAFIGWAVITLLLEIYDLFRAEEASADEAMVPVENEPV